MKILFKLILHLFIYLIFLCDIKIILQVNIKILNININISY